MRGPELRRINGDSTWLLQLPINDANGAATTFNVVSRACWRLRYAHAHLSVGQRKLNVLQLLDPWLDDSSQVDFAPRFSEQRRIVPSLTTSVAALESLLQSESDDDDEEKKGEPRQASSHIDAILISHPFTDHAHPETLLDESLPARIPIYTAPEAGQRLRALLTHVPSKSQQRNIVDIEVAKMDEKSAPAWFQDTSLGANVHFVFLSARESIFSAGHGVAWPSLHGAVAVLYRHPESATRDIGSILYSPHGLAPTSVPRWLTRLTERSQPADDRAKHVLIQSFDRQELPWILAGTVATGLPGAIEVAVKAFKGDAKGRAYNADYILATHDEHKEGAGVVARLLRRYFLGQRNIDGSTGKSMLAGEIQKQAQALINDELQGGRPVTALVLGTEDRLQL